MADGDGQFSPWVPMTDRTDIAVVGKLMEELNECGAALARSLIQGIDEADPDTGVVNRIKVEKEVADVLAKLDVVIEHFGLNRISIGQRAFKKTQFHKPWFAWLRAEVR